MRIHQRHVVVVMSNFWPEPTGGSPPATEFSAFLRRAGIPVTVVTSMPYYPQWEIWPEYRGRVWMEESHQDLRILRSWHFLAKGKVSTLTRILHELTLSLFALPNLLRAMRGASEVFLFTPALSFAFVGSIFARLAGARRTTVVKDVMPDAAIELGMMTNPLMIRVSRGMAKSLYDSSAEIHTLGHGMQRRIAMLSGDPQKVRIVPDTVDGAELAPVPYTENEFRKRFVEPGTFAVLHTGNMGKKQDVDLILRAAQQTRDDPTIRYFVFGDGVERPAFLEKRDRLGLANVSHHPLQERWLLKHMLSGADVVLVSQLQEVVDIVVPSKMLTALVSGAMVVAACPPASEPARMLGAGNAGIVIPAEDESAFVRTIREIQGGRVDTAGFRRRARDYALKTFDREAVYGPIASAVRSRVDSSSA